MKLDFPVDASVGKTVLVTWDIEASYRRDAPGLLSGDFEGRVIKIDGNKITVHFVYSPKGTANIPEETLVIDLDTGLDEKYGGVVGNIKLKPSGTKS